MYTALYRKWRPKNFNDVIGQEHITKTLTNQIMSDKIAHAYLFCGTRGTGKTSTAKIFSRAVNCTCEDGVKPCNECPTCTHSLSEANMDIIEIDAASNTSVENVREIIENVKYTPSESKYKVYIIDEVHMLSTNAFNALLKTLEEPPSHAIFILATTDVQKVPLTILSRCQRFDFKRISANDMSERIEMILAADDIKAEEEALKLICRLSDGAMRDALSILEQCISFSGKEIKYEDVIKVLGMASDDYLYHIASNINNNDIEKLLTSLSELLQSGKDAGNFLVELLNHFRNIMVVKSSKNSKDIIEVSESKLSSLAENAEQFTQNKIIYVIKVLSEALQEIKWMANKRLFVEMTLIKLCSPEFEESKEALLNRISKLENSIENLVTKINNGSFTVTAAPGVASTAEKTSAQNVAEATQPKVSKVVINDAINYCLKNWAKILGELREKNVVLLSTWSILDEAIIRGKGNTLSAIVDNKISEMSLKREAKKICDFLEQTYGMQLSLNVVFEKNSEDNKMDEIEYIIEKTKEAFGDIEVEIKE